MAQTQLLGLFGDIEGASDAIQGLHGLKIADESISVLSGAPLRPQMLGRPKPRNRIGRFALLGACLGVALGLFLSVGLFLLYPLEQGGQPIVPIPPSIIVLFEATMLGTMWTSFFALLGENRFPVLKRQIYDPRISEGFIGVAVTLDESLVDPVRAVFSQQGAEDVVSGQPDEKMDRGHRIFWASTLSGLALLLLVVMLLAYNVLRIPFPTNMANQESVAYLEGPRLSAPPEAVPIQGPELIAGQPATAPQPASADSLKRGKQLFTLVCAVCHGAAGDGKSPLAGFFTAHHPADLTGSTVQELSDAQIYLTITNGFRDMPPMAENLDMYERWDVVNYVRTLQK